MDASFEQKVRERAYEIWMAAGMSDGMAQDHWFAAEQALTPAAKPTTSRAKTSAVTGNAKPKAASSKSAAKKAAAKPAMKAPARAAKSSNGVSASLN